jgi:hypothetical protein
MTFFTKRVAAGRGHWGVLIIFFKVLYGDPRNNIQMDACEKCGHEMHPGFTYCGKCGHKRKLKL